MDTNLGSSAPPSQAALSELMSELTGGIASALPSDGSDRRMLLDLEPRAFLSAMDELGFSPERREYLLREYRRQNSPLSRLYRGIQSVREGDMGEGRRRASILPMTRPEGMTGYEALRSGEADFAVPEFVLGGIEGALSMLDMPGATLRGPVSESEAVESAMELAGSLALPTLAARPDPNVARMFGGRGTQNDYANRAMDRAEELRDQGLGVDEIWRKTAEEFPDAPASILPDGRPFYEMSDAEALTQQLSFERQQDFAAREKELLDQYLATYDLEERTSLARELADLKKKYPAAGVTSTPLRDVMTHPQLYQDFPRAGDIKAQLAAVLPSNIRGHYIPPPSDVTSGVIQVSGRYGKKPADQAGILLHETQHGIAEVSRGIPRGTNPEAVEGFIQGAKDVVGKRIGVFNKEKIRLNDRLRDMYYAKLGSEDSFSGKLSPGLLHFDEVLIPLHDALDAVESKAVLIPKGSLDQALHDLTKGYFGVPASYGLYRVDPGEALARATASRRELSMSERGATTPMETLRQESPRVEWDQLTKPQSEYDLLDYLEGRFGANFEPQPIEGFASSDYLKAIDLAIDELPDIMPGISEKIDMAASPEARREIINQAQGQVRRILEGKLKGFRPSTDE